MTSDLRKHANRLLMQGRLEMLDTHEFCTGVIFDKSTIFTPDGENCGLVKTLAITAIVSSKIMAPISDKLVSCGMEKLDESPLSSTTKMDEVFLKGDWTGVCADPSSFVESFRCMHRNEVIHPQVEIKRGKHQKEYLMDQEIIELIGVEEEEDVQTASEVGQLFVGDKGQPLPRYSHGKLELSCLLGLSCEYSFCQPQFCLKVLYQSEKRSQQVIGFSTDYKESQHQRLIIILGLKCARPEYFSIQNAIVAINVLQGYKQEDSLVMIMTSLEHSIFRTEHFRSYKSEVKNKDLTNLLKSKDKVDLAKLKARKGGLTVQMTMAYHTSVLVSRVMTLL
uniref:DNA-directed RNA polymerase n=1 Tax=Ananas comosus var. bracteatus TaxID=296719 RepID=A0A6V7NTV2_ANACO|nr:unnamed protein product [Ananas comosus var. bracteatus]